MFGSRERTRRERSWTQKNRYGICKIDVSKEMEVVNSQLVKSKKQSERVHVITIPKSARR